MKTIVQLKQGREVPCISETGYAQTMHDVVEPALEVLRTVQEVPVNGGSLHAENYILPEARAAIVLLHGFTESAEKFREMVWYFVQAGYSVFSYDERGHGRSLRLVEDLSLTHVTSFQDYVKDLEIFMDKVVCPAAKGLPLYLYGHSMGGAVSAHYLVRHPDTFEKAILTSPMIAPSAAPFPLWMGRVMAGFFCLIGKKKERAFIGGPFEPEKEVLETSCSTSAARFEYYKAKRVATPYLQNTAPTYGWVWEAAAQTHALMKPGAAAAIKTKVLLCQAVQDNTVLKPAQEQFVALIPGAKLVRFEEARHEIYNSTDDTMHPYVETVLKFYD